MSYQKEIINAINLDLTGHYLTGNPLIHEYFEGELPEQITEILMALRLNRD